MSNPSSPNPEANKNLLSAISLAADLAERNKRRFWLLSSLWVVAMIATSLIFVQIINTQQRRIDSNLANIAAQRDQLIQLRTTIEQQRETMEQLKDTILPLANLNWDALDTVQRDNLGVNLAQKESSRTGSSSGGRLSQAEQDFLERFSTEEIAASAEEAFVTASADLALGNFDSAIDYSNQALHGFDEPFLSAYLTLGRAHLGKENYEQSISVFTEALDIIPSPELWTWLCLAQSQFALTDESRMGFLADAETSCNAATNMSSSYSWAYHVLGFVYLFGGDFEEAIGAWESAAAARIDPEYSAENISLAYLWQNDWAAALAYTQEFNDEYGTASSWNWVFRTIAAGEADDPSFEEALSNWRKLRTDAEIESLDEYLPEPLKRYLTL